MNRIDLYPLTIVYGLPPVLAPSDKCAIDSEFFGMDKKRLHRSTLLDGSPNGKFAVATFCWDGKTVYMVTDEKELAQAFENIKEATWVFQNAKFDITHLRRFAHIPMRLKKFWDTMLISQIQYSGYYDSFSLGDLVRRELNCYMPKEEQKGFEKATELSEEQIKYAAYDCLATWHVYKKQRERITSDELWVWANIELPFLWTILGMSGIKLDIEKWTALAVSNKERADAIRAKYPEINLASPAQVKKELHRLKHKVNSTGEEILRGIADKCEFAKDVLEFRTFSKRASTYGLDFIEKYVEHDGMIHSDIFQMGAITGRTSSRAPNQQNQINETEYRDCYIADSEDDCLCVADWSSQEPRIAAYLSNDSYLNSIFNTGKDIYELIAKDVFHDDFSKCERKEWKKRRKPYKSLILGIFYGMSAYGLSSQLGIDKDEAQEMINTFLDAFPGVVNYIEKQIGTKHIDRQEQWKFPKSGYVQSIYGRKIWLNPHNYGWARDALNYPIQSSAADAMKISAFRVCREWDDDFYDDTPLKLLVHDELGTGCHESGKDMMKEVMERVMVSVSEEMHPGIPAISEVGCASSWAQAKL